MIGMRVRIVLAAVLTVATLAPASAQQQVAAADDGRPSSEMAGIQRSLDRLVQLLEEHIEHQRADLLLKRIQLKERRIAPAERRLRDAETSLLGREAEIKRMQAMLEEQRRVLDDENRDGTDPSVSGTRNMIAELERVIRTEDAQLDDARMRVRRLEDELADQREEIEILDDLLLEMLE